MYVAPANRTMIENANARKQPPDEGASRGFDRCPRVCPRVSVLDEHLAKSINDY